MRWWAQNPHDRVLLFPSTFQNSELFFGNKDEERNGEKKSMVLVVSSLEFCWARKTLVDAHSKSDIIYIFRRIAIGIPRRWHSVRDLKAVTPFRLYLCILFPKQRELPVSSFSIRKHHSCLGTASSVELLVDCQQWEKALCASLFNLQMRVHTRRNNLLHGFSTIVLEHFTDLWLLAAWR